MRGGDAWGGESRVASRHGRLERSKTGARMSTRVTGSATGPSRPLRYFAGTADRWVVLPILQYSVALGIQGALSLVASLSTLIVFLFFQRYFIAGMTMWAVKG